MGRRTLVAVAAGVLGLVVLGGLGVLVAVHGGGTSRPAAIGARSYSTATWYLYTNGASQKSLTALKSVGGCDVTADVVSTSSGKHPSSPVVEPCELQFAVSDAVDTDLYAWINNVFAGSATSKNLALLRRNPNTGTLNYGLALSNAWISGFAFPKLDAAAPNVGAAITLTLQPEQVTPLGSCCSNYPNPRPAGVSATTALFKVDVGGTQISTATQVDSWGATQAFSTQTGTSQYPVRTPGTVSYDNLDLTVNTGSSSGAAAATTLHNWFNSLVVQGNSPSQNQKQVTLTLWDNTLSKLLLTLELRNTGIIAEPDFYLANQPESFELYVQGANLIPPSTSSGGTTTGTTTTTSTAATTTAATTTTATTTTTDTTTVPSKATGPVLTLVGTDVGTATLQWEGATADLYRVFSSLEPGGPYEFLAETADTTVTLKELKSGTAYYFVVRAVLGDQESDDSNEVEAKIP